MSPEMAETELAWDASRTFLARKIRSNQYWNSWNWLEVIRKRAKQLKLPLQLLRKAKDW